MKNIKNIYTNKIKRNFFLLIFNITFILYIDTKFDI